MRRRSALTVAVFGSVLATAAPAQSTSPAKASWTLAEPLTGRAVACEQGKIGPFRCQNVELLSYLPKESLGGSVGTDIWGWHDSTTGREFAVVGGFMGEGSTAFVEVTDPLHPKYLGMLTPHQEDSRLAQSVKVYGHYAFVGYELSGNGIQVFDLTQLRDVKTPTEFQETAHYGGLGNTHTIAVNPATGYLYVNGSNTCGGGLHMLDVRTPTKPVFAGCYTEPNTGRAKTGYVHDAQCVVYRGPDRQYQGREICINYAETGISIADVTDKKNPKTISIATYPNAAYVHQGWFTEDQRYIFVDDEGDEAVMAERVGRDSVRTRTIGFDLNDLDDPVLSVEFYNAESRHTDHNLYIRGRYMYQANYTAGLQVVDVADPKHPKAVGYLLDADTDSKQPASAWGSYPYFKNDVVAVSMSTGLALVRLLKR